MIEHYLCEMNKEIIWQTTRNMSGTESSHRFTLHSHASSGHTQLMKGAHKQKQTRDTATDAALRPLTHSHKHIYSLSAHTHTHGWHTGCLESKTIFPGSLSQGRRHGNWLTLNIPLPLGGSPWPTLSAVRARACTCWTELRLVSGQTFGKCVCTITRNTRAHTHTHLQKF